MKSLLIHKNNLNNLRDCSVILNATTLNTILFCIRRLNKEIDLLKLKEQNKTVEKVIEKNKNVLKRLSKK